MWVSMCVSKDTMFHLLLHVVVIELIAKCKKLGVRIYLIVSR